VVKGTEFSMRQHFIRPLLLCLPLLVAGCGPSDPPPIVELEASSTIDSAVRDVINEHLGRVRSEPLSADRHAELAMVYQANEFWEAAQGAWSSALSLEPKRAAWIYHRSTCLRQAGYTDDALLELVRSVKLDGNSPASRNDLGVAWMEEGELEKAADEFQSAIDLHPEHPTPLVGLAEVRVRQDSFQEAATLCESALKKTPDYKHAHYTLGLAYRGLGRADEARDELNKGLNAKRISVQDDIAKRVTSLKTSYTSRLAQASGLEARGEHAAAAVVLEKVVASRPNDVTALNNLAAIYSRIDRVDDAIAIGKKAQQIDPTQFATYINLSSAYLTKGQVGEALDQADRAVSLASDVGRCYFVRARAYVAMKRPEDAYRDLQRSVELDATQWISFAVLGDVALGLNRLPEAVQAFRTTLRMEPGYFPGAARLTLCLHRLGNRPEAIAAFERARAMSPNHVDIATLKRQLGL
jgi:protein O-GlcNAc transferase